MFMLNNFRLKMFKKLLFLLSCLLLFNGCVDNSDYEKDKDYEEVSLSKSDANVYVKQLTQFHLNNNICVIYKIASPAILMKQNMIICDKNVINISTKTKNSKVDDTSTTIINDDVN